MAVRLFLKVKDDEKEKFEEFWKLNSYVAGSYDKAVDFATLDKRLTEIGGKSPAHRLFYLALPPTVYASVSSQIHTSCMAKGYAPPPPLRQACGCMCTT